MKKSIVMVGVGEIGSVFARGFMRCGYPIVPVTREMNMADVAVEVTDPELVVISVGENDLHEILSTVPNTWKDRLVLIQNELLPNDWNKYELNPTVISVWFEKKKGMDSKVLIASPVYGDYSQHLMDALGTLDITTRKLDNAQQLLHELVLKNVYILTTNIAGLSVSGNVGELWEKHQNLAITIANEIIQLQEKLTGESLSSDELIAGMVNAFNGDLNHGCMGRSAPGRLARALTLADEYGLKLETLRSISKL